MKKLAVAALVALATALSSSAASFMLSVDTPKNETSKEHKGPSKSSRRRNKKMTDISTTQTFYNGKVRCTLGKGETADVTVEVYFITRGVGNDRSPESIASRKTVASMTFAPGGPSSQEFSVESPKTKMTKRTEQYRGSVEKSTSGTALSGAVFRLIGSEGVISVKTVPRNAEWEKLAKKPAFELPRKRH